MQTPAIGKCFMQNRIKSRKIFLHTSINILENFNIKHLRWSKTVYPKKQKERLQGEILYEFCPEVYRQKGVLNNFATCLFAYHEIRH